MDRSSHDVIFGGRAQRRDRPRVRLIQRPARVKLAHLAPAPATALTVVPLLIAAALWGTSLQQVDVGRMNDLGLVSVLPARFFLGLGVLGAGFAWSVTRRQPRHGVLLLYLALLIVMLYGTPRLIEDVPRFAVTWRHVGITDYVVRHGSVDPDIDAYFSWPGFFILLGFLTKVAGLHSAIELAGWAPVFFNALCLTPLLGLVGWATRDRRLVWLTAWIFFSWNWIGQDYLSPQALCFFAYLVIVMVLLRWFATPVPIRWFAAPEPPRWFATPEPRAPVAHRLATWVRRRHAHVPAAVRGGLRRVVRPLHLWARVGEPRPRESTPAQRVVLMASVIVVFAAMVPSHQLTPFVVVASVTALVVSRRVDSRGLPTLMILLCAAWLAFMAVAYLAGHLAALAGNVGDVQGSLGANVSSRVAGSSMHMAIVYGRLLFTAVLWSLAVIGVVRRWRRGRRDTAMLLLASAPFIAVPSQPYGGEILLRVFLFTLPAMAFFAAAAVYPSARRRPGPGAVLATLLLCTVPLGALMATRYGNERGDAFSSAEVQGVAKLYELAPHGSLLLAAGDSTPWKWAHYEQYRYQVLTHSPEWQLTDLAASTPAQLRAVVERIMGGGQRRSFLLITASQQADDELLGTLPAQTLPRLEASIASSPRFVLRFGNSGTRIYELRQANVRGGP
jgi:hypothetical protein